MRSKALLTILGVFLALTLVAGTCSAGFIAGRVYSSTNNNPISAIPGVDTLNPNTSSSGDSATPQDLETTFAPFWQAWDLVHQEYVDQPVDDQALMRGAIKGMLDSLGDPHTSYMDPEQFQMLNSSLQGNDQYEGIGAWVDTTGNYLTIISPMPKSPAEKAGLRSGDQILAIDGEDMTGLDGELVRQKVLGPAGSTVTLKILREGREPFEVDVKRASITTPDLESRMLDSNVGYIHLFIFGDKTKEELRDALTTLLAQKPAGIILDLRYNGGGYLRAAVDVASEFISDGVILYEEYGDGKRTTYEAQDGGIATEIPLVVLLNEGSASASEIVAGAIQDHKRGQLVGVTSFGKGSVQIPTTLMNDAGAVRITVARWLTPNERTIHGVGLQPDVEVQITQEDIDAHRDPQLDKAVEILTHP